MKKRRNAKKKSILHSFRSSITIFYNIEKNGENVGDSFQLQCQQAGSSKIYLPSIFFKLHQSCCVWFFGSLNKLYFSIQNAFLTDFAFDLVQCCQLYLMKFRQRTDFFVAKIANPQKRQIFNFYTFKIYPKSPIFPI